MLSYFRPKVFFRQWRKENEPTKFKEVGLPGPVQVKTLLAF